MWCRKWRLPCQVRTLITIATCRSFGRCRYSGTSPSGWRPSSLSFQVLASSSNGRQAASGPVSMKIEMRDLDYPRALLDERRQKLFALRLEGPQNYPTPGDYRSCIRSIEQSIAELQRLIERFSQRRGSPKQRDENRG
jgi:hypothetical protein